MQLTSNETQVILWILVAMLGIFGSISMWMFNRAVRQMDKMSSSLSKMEKDLSVLANDHTNLKEEVKEVKIRLTQIEYRE